jgi:internalin A
MDSRSPSLVACFVVLAAITTVLASAADNAVTAEPEKLTDDQLRQALRHIGEKQQDGQVQWGDGTGDRLLSEVVRRGGKQWEAELRALIEERKGENEGAKQMKSASSHGYLSILTALRQIQHEPDPLMILVAGKASLDCKVGYLPAIEAALTNLDVRREPVTIQVEQDSWEARPSHWQVSVRDANGRELSQRPAPVRVPGKLSREYTLGYEESFVVRLRVMDYVDIPAPGTYTVHILYHDEVAIADRGRMEGMIVCKSLPLRLEVSPIEVEITDEDRKAARDYIRQLPAAGRVKILGGSYNEYVHDFIAPESPCGRLLKLDWKAVPDLIDAALDPQLGPAQRAQVLAILFSVTHQHDPRGTPGVLGPYEYRHSGWVTWGGPDHVGPFSLYSSSMESQIFGEDGRHETSRMAMDGPPAGTPAQLEAARQPELAGNGKIDEKVQIQFAEQWRAWKENGYIRVKQPTEPGRNVASTSASPTGSTVETEQAKAIAQIEKLGARVTVTEETPGKPVIEVYFFATDGTDASLPKLKDLPNLKSLELKHTDVTDAGLANLKKFTQLQTLDLSSTMVTDTGLEHLKGLAQLQTLNLEWNQITDAGLVHLKGLSQLQSLNLMNTKVSGPGLVHLKGLTQLQTLNLEWNQVADTGLVHLERIGQLQTLNLNGTKITDAGLEHLKRLAKLRTLDLTGTQVTDAGLKHLSGLTQLQMLSLNGTQITDAGLVNLKGLLELEDLNLDGTKVADAGMKHVESLTKLQTLCLAGTKITDAGLVHVERLSNLKSLDLSKTQITDAGLVRLKVLSHLETLDLNGTKVSSAGIKTLQQALPKRTVHWNPPALPAANEIRNWSDNQLRAALEESELGGENALLLLETVRRGDDGWKKFLASREESLNRLLQSSLSDSSNDAFFARWRLSNLELLTALRRNQNRPDPLRILIAGKLKRSYPLDEKPDFALRITNLDEEKRAVHGFTIGGDYRTGRLARWRFEIRDEKGKMVPIISPFGFIGGGISQQQTLEYGESWEAELPLKKYVHITAPGKYTMRVYYHNTVEIVDRERIDDLICSHSAEMTLEVTPIRMRVTEQERQNARKWISELPDAGPVKMAIGIAEPEKFLDPKSAPGKLQRMYTSAVPDLIDAALEPSLKPVQRAWVLAMLFAITGHNDPRGTLLFGGNEILGPVEYMGEGEGSSSGGKIDLEKQRAFAETWRVWKTDHYYVVEKQQ